MEMNRTGRFASIPDDLLLLVLARLDPASLEEAGAVCQRWHNIVSNDGSWLRALRLEFGRRPFERLQPSRMPEQHKAGWVSKDPIAPTWRNELVHRIGLRKLWTQAQNGQQRKREFGVRTSAIDALIVNERSGWALAVSMSGRAAVKCNPQTGKVFARDDNTKDIVFAPGEGTVSAVVTRLDRIAWGMNDGKSGVSHLTRDGGFRQSVVSAELPNQPITCVAGAYDALAQVSNEWSAIHKVSDSEDLIASAGSGGSVLVWSATLGKTKMVLHGACNAPLSRVTWASGQRYVVAASEAGCVFVWDLEADEPDLDHSFARAHWLRPNEDEYVNQDQSRENEYVNRRRPFAVFPIPGYTSGAVNVVLLAGDPFSSVFVVATETCVARVSVDGTTQTMFELSRTASSSAAITAAVWQIDVGRPRAKHPESTHTFSANNAESTRLLLVGDATGSVWMFDGDGSSMALQRWEHLHKRAVAALAVNAALVVSAARDGQMYTVDVLSGRILCADRCRSGRQANGQLDPWFWSVHPMLRSADTQVEVRRARMLATRSAAQWDDQVHNGVDTLDRNNAGYPTMVTQIVIGYAWILAANNMHIHATFAGHTAPQTRKQKSARRVRASSIDELLAEGIEDMRVEAQKGREHLLWAHETRGYVEREFERPAEELGLSPDEQMAYALWLSSTQASGEVTPEADPSGSSGSNPNAGPEPATLANFSENEQMAYALWLSSTQASGEVTPAGPGSNGSIESGSNPNTGPDPATLAAMSEDEQMAYALWLSSTQTSDNVAPGADPNGSKREPVDSVTVYSGKTGTARLRVRRSSKQMRSKDTKHRHRVAVGGRNVVLSTRNPLITWLAKNELTLSFAAIFIVRTCSWLGFAWPQLFLTLQHSSPNSHRFTRGACDVWFVINWIFQILAARSIMLHNVLPLIPQYFGVKSSRSQRRFGETGWFLCYIVLSWSIGFSIWRDSPYYMNTRHLYANYPEDHVLMPYSLKWYYLVQTAFWISNLYTIFVEERRKDHMEMLTHHVVTIALVVLSYTFHFTRFGHVFMLVMDFPDVFLSLAKLVRYLGNEMAPNILFGLFTISWVATKHYLCIKMMISIWTEGIFEVPMEKRFPHCPDSYASYPIVGFMWAILCVLQAVLIYWFVMILKVLEKVLIKGEDAADERSDEESDSEDEAKPNDTGRSN
ncbi:Sphingosine N-acyltransferase lag1 [Coemansia sp. RSA 1878]|nr:Sphingosine N-acyltransferase lag1 [Coemansia sp. RSA 1878]